MNIIAIISDYMTGKVIVFHQKKYGVQRGVQYTVKGLSSFSISYYGAYGSYGGGIPVYVDLEVTYKTKSGRLKTKVIILSQDDEFSLIDTSVPDIPEPPIEEGRQIDLE